MDPVEENERASREAERSAWMSIAAAMLFMAGIAVGGVLMLWVTTPY